MKKKDKSFFSSEGKIPLALLVLIFYLILTLPFSNTAIANRTTNFQEVKISLEFKNAKLEDVFKSIQKQCDYRFLYNNELLQGIIPINISVKNETLEQVLTKCLNNTGLVFELKDKVVLIKEKPPVKAGEQTKKTIISGVVKFQDNTPVPEANIQVKGTSKGTTSDLNGKFEISVGDNEKILVFSFLGMKTKEVEHRGMSDLNVTLEDDEMKLQQAVVTGMFTRKAETFTGSTRTFSQNDLLKIGNVDLIKNLTNLDPSFRMVENLQFGSDPNRLPDIQMRGQTGLPDLNNEYGTNPNLPLFILDGFETDFQRIKDLDIYLVKSVTLLKDAASKSVYGSRAANGVVVIETIRPPAGNLQVNYNFNLNVELPDLSSYNLCNARQKYELEMRTNSLFDQTNPPYYGALYYTLNQRLKYDSILEEILRGVDTYWLSQPLRSGIGQKHSLTLGGGREELQYYVELGYNDTKGVMIGSARKVYSGGIQLDYRKKNLTVSNKLRIYSTKGENSPYGTFRTFSEQNPYERLIDTSGNIPFSSPMHNGNIGVRDFTTESTISNNTDLIWNIKSYLKFNGRVGVSHTIQGSDLFLPASHNSFPEITQSGFYDPNSVLRGSYSKSNGILDRMNSTLSLNFNKVFDKHAILANIGADVNSLRNENYSFKVVGFPSPNLDFPTAALQYEEKSRLSGTENTTRDIGCFTAINYSFDDRYLADFSWRLSRSSQFGTNNPDAEYWSLGIGWNIHNERFMKSSDFFDMLRITANTGYTGTQPLNAYLGFPVYKYQMDKLYYGQYSLGLVSMSNTYLGAQRKKDNNISVDTRFFKDKINITFDYYVSNTDGLLIDINIPNSTGFSTFKANQGKVENRGIDFRINYNVFQNTEKRNFLTIYATAGHNTNKLKELSNTLIALTSSQDNIMTSAVKQRFEVGRSINTIWAVPSMGIDPSTGKEVFLKKDGTTTYKWDAKDQIAAGDAIAKLYGNFGLNIRISGWQLNASFGYNFGGQRYNTTLVNKVENIDFLKNVDARVFTSRWKQPGDKAFFKGLSDLGTTYPTTRFVEDWNELTLSNINISYDLDRFDFIKKSGIKRFRASLSMDDAFVASSIRMERGTDYPFAKTFSFSFQLNF